MHLCPVCLRKLQMSLGFDPHARYQALEQEYVGAGLNDPAGWVQRRQAFIEGGP